jgi:hypothetical protein
MNIIDSKLVKISDEEYFSDKYKDYINNSKLSLINPDQGGSLDKYREGGKLIENDSLVLGTAVHNLILQPNEFELDDKIDKPSAKKGMIVDYILRNKLPLNGESISEAIEAVDYFGGNISTKKINELRELLLPYYNYVLDKNDNKIRLPARLANTCKECVKSVTGNADILELLYPENMVVHNEITVLSKIELDSKILKFKGKIDSLSYNNDVFIVNDLKTTRSNIENFKYSFEKYHYARQLALYTYLLEPIFKNRVSECNIIAVQTIHPFTSGIFGITKATLNSGLVEMRKLIKLVANEQPICKLSDEDEINISDLSIEESIL